MSDYSQPPPDALIGQTIAGRYRIISRLGAGGMGVAYRAWDEQEGRPVVVKMPKKAFLEDPTFAERFYREIRLLQGLRHEHIVPILNVGAHEVLPFVVMRFLPGGALSNRRLRDDNGKARPNPPGMLHLWLPAVAEALDFIHQMGVVHRDVKPANIFFDAFWGAFLGDFGIAKVVTETDSFDGEATLTATSMGIGTLDYMGPELFVKTSNVDGRADQYALAVVAYEMLAGTRPFTGDMDNIVVEVTKMLPPRLDQRVAGLPRSAVEAVHRGLAKRPADRFASCRQFAAALLRDIPPLEPETDTARFLCPSCSNLLRLPVTAAGRKGKCPKCKEQMKIADDLGTLWLLDEQRRQRLTPPNATPTNALRNPVEPEPPAADEALEDFKPISDHTSIRRLNPRRRKRTANADLVGSVAVVAVAVALAFVLFQVLRPTPPSVDPSGPQPRRREQPIAGLAEPKQNNLAPSQAGPSALSPEKILAQKPLINSAGIPLKQLPAGTFIMGSEDGEPDEQPAHTVRITRPFYIGVTEVTNPQWKRVMGGDPPSRWKEDVRPVEMVTWNEAVEFCRRLGEMPEEKAAGRVYRLPTEAEWEYACRAGTTTRFSFGDDESQYGDFGWFPANADKQTRPVGQKKPNAWGLHDMHGNVWEWCSDWYGPYPSGIIEDPTGPARGSSRIHRGGGYATNATPAAFRQEDRNLALRHERLGFRVVLSAPAGDPPPLATEPAVQAPLADLPKVEKESATLTAAYAALRKNPDDQAANSLIGCTLCFDEGRWREGLPLLAQADIEPWKRLANAEITAVLVTPARPADPIPAAPTNPGAIVRVAKAWWAARTKAETATSAAIAQHAAAIYSDNVSFLKSTPDVQFVAEWLDGDMEFRRLVNDKRPPQRPRTPFSFTKTDLEREFTFHGDVAINDNNEIECRRGRVGGRVSEAVTKTTFKIPMTVDFDAYAFADKTYDIFPAILTDGDGGNGIKLVWGAGYNRSTTVNVFGTFVGLPHVPIEPGRTYRITFDIDEFRNLSIMVDDQLVHTQVLPDDTRTEGHISCCGGIGHVAYKSLSVQWEGAQTAQRQPTPSPNPAVAGPVATLQPIIPESAVASGSDLVNSLGIKLKRVDSRFERRFMGGVSVGAFVMGSDEPRERPAHQVTLTRSFYIGVTEVTNAEWRLVMGREPPSEWKDAQRPVESLTWESADEFCRKLSEVPAERKAGRVYRLPTEAEWEYACRAGTTTKHAVTPGNALRDVAWFRDNSDEQSHPAAEKAPNAWGLFDMQGNVREWCSNWYEDYRAAPAIDPGGPADGVWRVVRGGAFLDAPTDCRPGWRHGYRPDFEDATVGFRIALSPPEKRPPDLRD